MAQQTSTRLLNAEVDWNGRHTSHFRILVDNKSIKYLMTDGGIFEPDDLFFEPTSVTLLPELPAGDWNEGYVTKHAVSGLANYSKTEKTALPGIHNSQSMAPDENRVLRSRSRRQTSQSFVPSYLSPIGEASSCQVCQISLGNWLSAE